MFDLSAIAHSYGKAYYASFHGFYTSNGMQLAFVYRVSALGFCCAEFGLCMRLHVTTAYTQYCEALVWSFCAVPCILYKNYLIFRNSLDMIMHLHLNSLFRLI